MIKHLITGITILLSISTFSPYTLADLEPEPEPKTVQELVTQYSKEYGVSATRMMATIRCENVELDPTLQSRLKYKAGNRWKQPAGSYEQSYGLVQIHLPDHPDITYEQATNPEFAINWMAEQFSEGRARQWTCYRTLYA